MAGVDYLAVARADLRADGGLGFDDHRLDAAQRQRAGAGEADHTRADDHRAGFFSHVEVVLRQKTGT